MTDSLKKFNEISNIFEGLKEDFLEMGQLKSDFDSQKYTVAREGCFLAHQFHFLMRQYSLALYEAKRMLLERETKLRDIQKIKSGGQDEKYPDLAVLQIQNEIDLLDVTVTNKLKMIEQFHVLRLKIIDLNGGKSPTNEDYQLEEPRYWEWVLQKKALNQSKAARTGISEGIWENLDYLEEPAMLNPEYQVKMLDENGFLNLEKAQQNIKMRLEQGQKQIASLENKNGKNGKNLPAGDIE